MKPTILTTMLVFAAAPLVSAADEQKDEAKNPPAVNATLAAEAAMAATGECPAADWLNVETVTLAAANGDPLAQFTLAWLTEKGTSTMPADPEAAAQLYAAALPGLQQAADQGNRGACMVLAAMYAHGKGVAPDPEKAAHYASKVQGRGFDPCDSNQRKCGGKPCGDQPCAEKPCSEKNEDGKCCAPAKCCTPESPQGACAPKS